jgi:hypothetical protein
VQGEHVQAGEALPGGVLGGQPRHGREHVVVPAQLQADRQRLLLGVQA